jgi:hypothetical protein
VRAWTKRDPERRAQWAAIEAALKTFPSYGGALRHEPHVLYDFVNEAHGFIVKLDDNGTCWVALPHRVAAWDEDLASRSRFSDRKR